MQNKLFAELAGRALLQPEFREAVLKYPEVILGGEGLTKGFQDALVKALKSENLDKIKVADLPDLFGANRWGFFGSVS
jgi:hypothetical protein